MPAKKKAEIKDPETVPGVPVNSGLSEINTEGVEAKPGVDTTAEGLAKKYGQPIPEGVKPVLGADALDAKKTAKKAAGTTKVKTPAAPARERAAKDTAKGTTAKNSGSKA